MIVCVSLAACAADGKPRRLPTLRELGRRGPAMPQTDHREPPRFTRVHRIDLSQDANLSEAWSLVSAPAASPAVLKLWQRNGLRVGVLESAAAGSFLAALPAVHGHKEQLFIGTGAPLRLHPSALLREAVPVRIRVDGDDLEGPRLVGGQCWLVLHTTRLEGGRTFAQLSLEHGPVRPKRAGAKPGANSHARWAGRSATNKRGTGGTAAESVLKDFSLVVPLDGGQMLVMGLNAVDKRPPETKEAPDDSPEPSPVGDVPPAAEPEDEHASGSDRRVITNNLGRVLFTGQRAGRGVQVLMFIACEDRGRTKAEQ